MGSFRVPSRANDSEKQGYFYFLETFKDSVLRIASNHDISVQIRESTACFLSWRRFPCVGFFTNERDYRRYDSVRFCSITLKIDGWIFHHFQFMQCHNTLQQQNVGLVTIAEGLCFVINMVDIGWQRAKETKRRWRWNPYTYKTVSWKNNDNI